MKLPKDIFLQMKIYCTYRNKKTFPETGLDISVAINNIGKAKLYCFGYCKYFCIVNCLFIS